MKTIILAITVMVSFGVQADEVINFTNGATAFRTDSGYTYGYSGGVNTGDSGFNDARTGARYESTGGNQMIDTRTGRFLDVPDNGNNSQQQEE